MKLLVIAMVLVGSAFTWPGAVAARQAVPSLSDSTLTSAIADESVPYGVASGYLVGRALLRDGNASEALPYLHMAYRAQPEVVTIATDFQAALAAEGYFNDALEVVTKLFADNPDSLDFLAERAELYLKAGKAELALGDLRELRQQGHVTAAIIGAEASILAQQGHADQALDVYRDGLALLPDDGPTLYLGMTGILQQAEQEERILPLMAEALGQFPDAPRLWLVKIRMLVVRGQDAEALAAARAADTHFAALMIASAAADTLEEGFVGEAGPAHLPPDSFVVELADFYAQRNELSTAMGILQPLSDAGELQLAPSLWLGRLLLGTDHAQEGETLVARILERWPDSGRAWFLKGKAAEGRGDWQGAVPDMARAVEFSPRDPELRLGYVRAMLVAWGDDLAARAPTAAQEAERVEFRRHLMVASTLVPEEDQEGQLILGYGLKAIADYERAAWRFGLAAERKDLRLSALLQQSICLDLRGDDVGARKALETLHSEYPAHPEIANSLGYFLAEKGQSLDQARELVEQALAAEPGNGAYLDSMGWIEYRVGDLEKALDYLIQAVNVLPDDPVILEHLGMVLRDQGKITEARDVLQRALNQGGEPARLEVLIDELKATVHREP